MTSTLDRSLGWTRRDIAATFQRMLQQRYEEVGREVRRLRLRKGLTHEGLAHAAGVSVKTISRVENGRLHEHRGSTYRKIAAPLGVTAEHLLAPIFTSPGEDARGPEVWPEGLPGPPRESDDSDDRDERESGTG